jgi:hypothetical protein
MTIQEVGIYGLREENRLEVFGTCCWRNLHNNELHNLYSLPDCNDKMTKD